MHPGSIPSLQILGKFLVKTLKMLLVAENTVDVDLVHPHIRQRLTVKGDCLGRRLLKSTLRNKPDGVMDEDFPKLLFPFQNEHPISRFVKAAGVSFRPILTL